MTTDRGICKDCGRTPPADHYPQCPHKTTEREPVAWMSKHITDDDNTVQVLAFTKADAERAMRSIPKAAIVPLYAHPPTCPHSPICTCDYGDNRAMVHHALFCDFAPDFARFIADSETAHD
jgi:hypothetical protein